jgi:hypothetical protein
VASINRSIPIQAGLEEKKKEKKTSKIGFRGMAQMIEYLPSKCEALKSNLHNTKKKSKK